MTLCALCACELVETKNGDSCPKCGMLTFGSVKKKITLFMPIKKFGNEYSSVGGWTSVKYADKKIVGWHEIKVDVSE